MNSYNNIETLEELLQAVWGSNASVIHVSHLLKDEILNYLKQQNIKHKFHEPMFPGMSRINGFIDFKGHSERIISLRKPICEYEK